MFDFRHEGWHLLCEDLKAKVRAEASRRRAEKNKIDGPSGYTRSEANKKSISETLQAKGIKPPGTLGLKKPEQERKEIGERTRQVMLGKKMFNNGEVQVRRHECPPGFVPGGLPRRKKR
jgi:hypothetical protein